MWLARRAREPVRLDLPGFDPRTDLLFRELDNHGINLQTMAKVSPQADPFFPPTSVPYPK